MCHPAVRETGDRVYGAVAHLLLGMLAMVTDMYP